MLVRELSLYRKSWTEPFDTVYFGGGTPGILLPEEIEYLVVSVRDAQGIADGAEITLEANPDDVLSHKLQAWQRAGINRISIGVQALDDHVLRWMNRSHSADEALHALHMLSNEGFTNVNADLIYGLPGITAHQLREWVTAFRDAGVTHISAYALTVEPRTVLAKQVNSGTSCLPEDELVSDQFLSLRQDLETAGFIQYELSNFALRGYESQHNAAYWTGVPYLGLGPSAHSFDGERRWWNVRSNARYLELLTAGVPAIEGEELLTRRERYHEYIMTGLRKTEGIDTALAMTLSNGLFSQYLPQIKRWKESGLMIAEGNNLRLTHQGMLLSDHIISRLFLDEAAI